MKKLVRQGLARLPIAKKIVVCRTTVSMMTGNAYFTTPTPSLATITANVNALEVASIAAAGGGPDDTANMHAKEVVLDLSMKLLGAYVEGIANATPITAEAIILSAGMGVKGQGGQTTLDFDVQSTGNPGELRVIRQAVSRGAYEFQMSTDPTNETNWQKIYRGTRGRILKTGLTSATRYFFRAMAIDKNGESPWSDVKSMVAL